MKLGRVRYTDAEAQAVADARIALHTAVMTAIHGIVVVRKTSDEIVNNSTVLQNDDELFLPVGANEIWIVNVFLVVWIYLASNFKLQWAVPAAGDFAFRYGQDDMAKLVKVHDAPQTYIVNVNGDFAISMTGRYVGGVNAGNLQLQWAQDSAVAENTIVRGHSFIKAHRML